MNLSSKFLLSALVGFASTFASAAPQQYAPGGVQNIRAGVVILDASKPTAKLYGRSTAPYAFYNLNNATGIKPPSWNFLNPHPQSIVTGDVVNRWDDILNGTPADSPVLGAPITKRNAEYWSVYLDEASDAILSDYDVLLLNPVNVATLNALERARLTKFVDQGGLLWIDPSANAPADFGNSFANSYPLSFSLNGTTGSPFANTFHTLLSSPYALTGQDLNVVSGTEAVTSSVGMQAVSLTGNASYDLADPAQFFQYLGVTYVGNGATISVAHVGDGEIVVTTQGVSQILNRSSGTSPFSNPGSLPVNTSYTAATPTLETDGISAAKLAVNIISQLQMYPQAGGGARKTGGSAVDVTAPVLSNWYQEAATTNSVGVAPVVYKGVTVVSTGSTITIYNSRPGSDLDQDGDLDDGIIDPTSGAINNNLRDYSLGKPYDVIWTGNGATGTPMVGPLSSPVCAEVADGAGGVNDIVMVVDSTGKLFVYNLFLKNSSGQLEGGNHPALYVITPPTAGFAYENAPNAPTVSGDLAFVADATSVGADPIGRLWVVDLSSGKLLSSTTSWVVGGGNTSSYKAPAYSASPTVGYIPIQDGSGGYDKVVYGPGYMVTGTTPVPAFNSLWFGTKDEASPYVEAAGTLTINTRLVNSSGVPLGTSIYYPPVNGSVAQRALAPRITFLDGNGQPLNPNNVMTSQPTDGGPGVILVNVNDIDFQGATPAVASIRVDYTIDWGKDPDTLSAVEERGKILFPLPPTGNVTRRILGPIALSPSGTLCMTVADPNPGSGDNDGSLWWMKESQGRGNFQVTGRWALYPTHTMPSSPTGVTSPPVFDDNDPLSQSLAGGIPAMKGPMSRWHWTGAPVIENGQVIATATAIKTGGAFPIPITVVMAFAQDPVTPQFQGSTFTPGFSLVQADFDKSSPGSVTGGIPDGISTLQQANFNYDQTSGTVQITNLAQINGGQITDCLSLSQPIIVRGGAGDLVYQPENNAGVWSPLHWYSVFNGNVAQGRPLVTGNTIFFASNSYLAGALVNNAIGSTNAVVNAMDATISSSDAFAIPSVARPYETQIEQVGTSGQPNPHIKMPSGSGISSFNDYKVRLVQQGLGNSSQAFGVVGGGTALAAWGNAGVYGLGRADFIVCDQGRVVKSDSSGNITFASNASLNTGSGGGSIVGNYNSLVRPTRAYSLSTTEMLVVDPGSNRVIKMNNAGGEERELSHFIVDPGHVPAGYATNEVRTFNAPQDAITYAAYVYKGAGPALVTNQGNVEYWVHYLIADSGNHRLVELIDRYSVDQTTGRTGALVSLTEPDPNATPGQGLATPSANVPQVGVLLWQSPANVSGKNFTYNSVSRVFLFQANSSGRYVYVCGVGNTQTSRTAVGLDTANNLQSLENSTGNSSIIVFDPALPTGIEVYNNYDSPDLHLTPLYQDNGSGKWDWVTTGPLNTKPINKPLVGLNSVTAKSILNPTTGNGAIALMVTEATGVYEFLVDPTQPNTGDLGSPDWFINESAYTELEGDTSTKNPAQFHPAYARRLESGDVILVNAYNGSYLKYLATSNQPVADASNPFRGEVLLLNGVSDSSSGANGEFQLGKQNLGFGLRSIKFNFPSPVGVRGVVAPIFADRR